METSKIEEHERRRARGDENPPERSGGRVFTLFEPGVGWPTMNVLSNPPGARSTRGPTGAKRRLGRVRREGPGLRSAAGAIRLGRTNRMCPKGGRIVLPPPLGMGRFSRAREKLVPTNGWDGTQFQTNSVGLLILEKEEKGEDHIRMAYYTRRRRGSYGGYRRYRPRYSTYRRTYRRSHSTVARRRTSTKKRATRTSTSHSGGSTLGKDSEKYLLALTDPFSENAEGVKIPDANAQPSVSVKVEDIFTITAAATETLAAWAFNPSTSKMAVQGVFASASSWTWAATYGGNFPSSKNTKMIADMDLWRPVAHGLRITCGLAPTTVTGFLHVAVFAQANYGQTTWSYPTNLADLSNVAGYKRIPLARLTAEGLVITNRPLDCTAQHYTDTDNPIYNGGSTNDGWNVPLEWASIIVVVEGVTANPTSTQSLLAIESILHTECIPRATSISTPSPAAAYSPAALGAASAVTSRVQAAVLDGDKAAKKMKAAMVAQKGVSKAIGGKVVRIPRKQFKIGGGQPKSVHRTIGIPGINDRSLPGSGKADVSMANVSFADYDL